jgi:hypothetical protein
VTNDQESNGSESKQSRWRFTPSITVALIAAAASVAAAIIAGLFSLIDNPSSPDQTADCGEFPVDVDYPAEPSGATAQITFDTHCAPDEGREFLPIIEAKDIGTDKHSEYYPKEVALTPGKADTIAINIGHDPDGQENCIFVLQSTHAQAQQLLSNLTAGNFTLHLPDGIPRASKSACGRTHHESVAMSEPNSGSQAQPGGHETAAVILYPPDNEAVPQTIAAKGTVTNLRSGQALFLALDYDGCYFVQSVQVNGSEWSTEMDIGGAEVASGHEFTLSAVITDQDLTRAQGEQESSCFKSLDVLKEKYGVVILTTNQIRRK